MLAKSKKFMLARHFRNQRVEQLEVPMFTEFSGRKLIIPFHNLNCNSHTCVYDLEELVNKYRASGYSNLLNFICHTCRKQLDIADFYRHQELERMITKLHH